MKKPDKVIIFDFDGTIADSVPIIRSIYTDMALKNNWKEMTDKDYEMLRRGSLSNARKWSGIRFWQFPLLIHNAKKMMKHQAENVELFPGMVEFIHELHAGGAKLYVLSRNSSTTIANVLKRYKLQDEMNILHRRKRFFGSKGAVISELIRDRNYDKNKVWMIGDEVRDIQAAKYAGVSSIAVSWGIQDTSILEVFHPTYLAKSIRDLKHILEV